MRYATMKQRAHAKASAAKKLRRKQHMRRLIEMVGPIGWRDKLASGRYAVAHIEGLRRLRKYGTPQTGVFNKHGWAQALVDLFMGRAKANNYTP